jgi:hypothetical protein
MTSVGRNSAIYCATRKKRAARLRREALQGERWRRRVAGRKTRDLKTAATENSWTGTAIRKGRRRWNRADGWNGKRAQPRMAMPQEVEWKNPYGTIPELRAVLLRDNNSLFPERV